MRNACLDADAHLVPILQLKISSPRKQSHFVKYRATQIVGNQGRSSSSISSPWSLQVQFCIWFCSFLAKEIICAYFNAKFVMVHNSGAWNFEKTFGGRKLPGLPYCLSAPYGFQISFIAVCLRDMLLLEKCIQVILPFVFELKWLHVFLSDPVYYNEYCYGCMHNIRPVFEMQPHTSTSYVLL